MTLELVVVPAALVAAVLVVVVLGRGAPGRRRPRPQRVRPFRAAALGGDGHLELATDWVHTRLRAGAGLDRTSVRRALGWIGDYVRAHSRPLNGEGRALGITDSAGWLVAPNMFDVVRDLQSRASAAGMPLDHECAWEICGLHDDFLRTRTG